MKTAPYLGIIKDDRFLITTIKAADERASLDISLQLNSWVKIYPNSTFRIAKIAKRTDNGWLEAE